MACAIYDGGYVLHNQVKESRDPSGIKNITDIEIQADRLVNF